MVNITYLIDQLRIGGTENQLIELVNRFDSSRFRIHIFTLRNYGNILAKRLTCPFSSLGINSIASVKTINRIISFISFLTRNQVDILQTFFPESTMLGSLCGKIAKVPYIVTTRREISSWHNPVNRLYLKLSNKLANRILVNSRAVRDYLAKEEKVQTSLIDVLYNGIDVRHFFKNDSNTMSPKKTNKVTIGIVSNFARPVKRFDLFVKSTQILAQRHSRVSFLIVGSINDSLKNMIPQSCCDLYQFSGPVGDVRPLLKKIDIGVLCSDSEGFSNVLLEYMASSVPCVATDAGGNPELIEEGVNGFLFKVGDAHSLAEKISILIEDPSLRTKFAANSRAKIQHQHDWSTIIPQYEEYYHGLLSGVRPCKHGK